MSLLRNVQLIDVNGNPLGQSQDQNFLNVTAFPIQTQVSRGKGPAGSFRWEGLGRNPAALTNVLCDIWEGTTAVRPQPLTAGERVAFVSTSTQDSAAGTGARSIYMHYIDSDGIDQHEIITLNGTTQVLSVATNVRFINSLHSGSVGTGGVANGNITCYRIGSPTTIFEIIAAGGNRSLSCATMVPAGKKLYITSWSCGSATNNAAASFFLRSTSHLHVEHPGIFIFQDVISLNSSSSYRAFGVPLIIPSLSVIKISSRSATSINASGSWEGWIE